MKRLKNIAVMLSVIVLRVGSDIFESARILIWVDSLQLESARLALHTLTSSGRVGSLVFESARAACHTYGRSGRVGSWTLGSARVIFVLNFLKRATIESARLLLESARVYKFRKLEIQLD